jgi:phage terminase large subunit GpA-like protein
MNLKAEIMRLWKPPPILSLSEWADTYAVLSAESSAEMGRWKTIPYQKGIMDEITSPLSERVTVMKSARVGFTKILNHTIGYHAHQDPCPMMIVQPTVEDAKGYSKEEIAPMIRDTPVLRNLFSEVKAKDGSNTILSKQFPGGTLGMVGANSARGFRRVSRRVVLFDETDGYPASTSEGDQIKLGIRRTEYFWNRKIIDGSTPTTKDFSRIEREFLKTDQRRYFVPCPECAHMQYLRWEQMKWQDDDPLTARYQCESCEALIPHSKKRWMVERGEWRATAQTRNKKHVGFHIWAAYSYSPNAGWDNLVEEFLECKQDPEALKTFVNTVLGETWEDDYASKVSAEGLMGRREEYLDELDDGVLLLTAGIDVQGGGGATGERLEVTVWGWGEGEEAWKIHHQEIHGDPMDAAVWAQALKLLQMKWRRVDGVEIGIEQTCVDSGGHATAEVYRFCRDNRALNVVAIKGSSRPAQPPIGRGSAVDLNHKGKTLKGGAMVYMLGTDTIKTTIFGRLKGIETPGPGFIHFGKATTEDYFKQLTAEKQILKRGPNGFPVRAWVKQPNARNEALDCFVYAYAALQMLYRRYSQKTIWSQFRAAIDARALKSELDSEKPAPRRSLNVLGR